jgi:hypothetical protein
MVGAGDEEGEKRRGGKVDGCGGLLPVQAPSHTKHLWHEGAVGAWIMKGRNAKQPELARLSLRGSQPPAFPIYRPTFSLNCTLVAVSSGSYPDC